ncbi:MAG: S-adenosylmethionine:tRNA ribosyltransferase-isomerase [Nitrospinae bacterium]|nr:S-adenosylmethionine:tRNA ribosyltransferase-isomerase [Nitrospinota bacterium]
MTKLSLFDYHLPEALIAQRPAPKRDDSRLMRLTRGAGAISHHRFGALQDLLRPGDVLVVNDTKVFWARLRGTRRSGGAVELLLVRDLGGGAWEAMIRGVFAREPGSCAAPTAGLHFTETLLETIRARGVEVASVTLHVGPGTFKPVTAEQVEDHVMDAEPYLVDETAARAVNAAKEEGRRVVAVGTTVTRTLESAADERGRLRPGAGETRLFITPGYTFRAVDAMVTNFHLPRSTLLMLVCAFAGRDHAMRAYEEAVRMEYRFYSYGDAMFIE